MRKIFMITLLVLTIGAVGFGLGITHRRMIDLNHVMQISRFILRGMHSEKRIDLIEVNRDLEFLGVKCLGGHLNDDAVLIAGFQCVVIGDVRSAFLSRGIFEMAIYKNGSVEVRQYKGGW